MDLYEKLIYLSIGGAIGFILGVFAARLRTIEMKVDAVKSEIHEVDEIVKGQDARDEAGYWRPSLNSVMLVIVLALTASAAFVAGNTNMKLNTTVECLTEYNTNQGLALDSRDSSIKTSADAEIELWNYYDKLYKQARNPKTTEKQQRELSAKLHRQILDYRDTLVATQAVRDKYQYDDPDVLKDCDGNIEVPDDEEPQDPPKVNKKKGKR